MWNPFRRSKRSSDWIGGTLHRSTQKELNSLLGPFKAEGYSLRFRSRIRGGQEDPSEACLRVYVQKKRPLSLVSLIHRLPEFIDDMPIDIVELGDVSVSAPVPLPRLGHLSSVMSGCSIGHEESTAGTMSGVVFGRTTGTPYVLGNRHVLAPLTTTPAQGDYVYQPGPLDARALDPEGSLDPIHKAARLVNWVRVNPNGDNYVDCALALPTDRNWFRYEPVGDDYQGMRYTHEARINDRVKKVGRTTGRTDLVIVDDSASLRVRMEDGSTYFFVDQILAVSADNLNKSGSAPGDSGSMVVYEAPVGYSVDGLSIAEGDELAVGLLFAGSETHTIVCKITPVLNALGVSLTKPDDPSVIWGEREPWPVEGVPDDAKYSPSAAGKLIEVVAIPNRPTTLEIGVQDSVTVGEPFESIVLLADKATGEGVPGRALIVTGMEEPGVQTDSFGLATLHHSGVDSPGNHEIRVEFKGD